MKLSGVEWLGEIPQGWEVMPAKALFKQEKRPIRPDDEIITAFRDGQVTLRKNRRTTGFTEATNYDTYQGIRKGDLVIHQMDAFAGCAGISDSDGMGSPILIACTPRRGDIEPRYYAEIVRIMGHSGFISALAKGVRERSADFRFETFARQLLPLPPLPEQRTIADYLDAKCGAIDAAIAEAKKGIEEYKAWKKSLIFEAVTGKRRVFNAEKQRRREAEKMKPSGIPWIGEIPEGWEMVPLKWLCTMQAGKTLSSEQIGAIGDYPVFGGNGIRGYFGEFNHDGPCLLVGRQGALCGNVHFVDGKIWATEHALITLPRDIVLLPYLNWLLIGMNLNRYVTQTAAQPGLAASVILNAKTILPPLSEQQAIADYLDEKCAAIDAMVAEKEALIADLEAYKKSLIYEVVTGKRRVA